MGDDVVEEQGAQEEGTNPGKSQQEVKVYCKDCDKSFPSKTGLAVHSARWCSALKRTKESVASQVDSPIENDDVKEQNQDQDQDQEEETAPDKSQQETKVYCPDCGKSFSSKHGLALHLARWCSAIKRTKESVETQEEFPIENDDVNAAESVSPLVAVEGAVQNIDTGGQKEDLDPGEETNAGENDDVDAAESVSPLVALEGAVQNIDTSEQNKDLDQEEETNAGENDDVNVAESVSPLVAAEGAVQNNNTGEQNKGLDQGEETNTGKNDGVDAAESVSPLVAAEGNVQNTTDTGEQNEDLDQGEETKADKIDYVDAAESVSPLVAVEGAVQNTTDIDTGKQNEDLDQGEETNADKSDKETKLDCKDCDKSFSSKSGLALHSARWCPAIKRMKESIEGQKDFPIENDGVEEQNQDQ